MNDMPGAAPHTRLGFAARPGALTVAGPARRGPFSLRSGGAAGPGATLDVHRFTVASMVSRRLGRMFPALAGAPLSGLGAHRSPLSSTFGAGACATSPVYRGRGHTHPTQAGRRRAGQGRAGQGSAGVGRAGKRGWGSAGGGKVGRVGLAPEVGGAGLGVAGMGAGAVVEGRAVGRIDAGHAGEVADAGMAGERLGAPEGDQGGVVDELAARAVRGAVVDLLDGGSERGGGAPAAPSAGQLGRRLRRRRSG